MLFTFICGRLALLGVVTARFLDRGETYTFEEYAVQLRPDQCPFQFSQKVGLKYESTLGMLPNHYIMSSSDTLLSKRSLAILQNSSNLSHPFSSIVLYFEKQVKTQRLVKRYEQPKREEPLGRIIEILEIRDPSFPGQWHLYNSREPGHDLNVTGVWLDGNFGQNVTVAIVDDGLESTSHELRDNFSPSGSHDFNDDTDLPTPRLDDDTHGTRCAAEIAAVRNQVCGVGVAYKAMVAGIRILSAPISDAQEATALNYAFDQNQIYSCSWGPRDDGATLEAPGELVKRAFLNGVRNGRQGKGSIFVFASGNGGQYGDNCNCDGYTNSIYSITIGAVDHLEQYPYYAEHCAAQLAVAYSSGSGDSIVSILNIGDCQN